MKGTVTPHSTSPAKCGRTTGSSRYCCRSGTACSPRSREATRKPLGLESSNHRFQGITKPSCLIGCELNNESPAAFKRDTHHDAAPLFGDLKRTVARPRLHRRPFSPPPSETPPRDLPSPRARRTPGPCGKTAQPQPFLSVALLS